MAKEICQDCGCVYETKSRRGLICPTCRSKRLSRYAKERQLNKLGNEAYSKQQARKRREGEKNAE